MDQYPNVQNFIQDMAATSQHNKESIMLTEPKEERKS
jgi:hypothetical protein